METRNLKEPATSDVREVGEGETVERRAPDHRVAHYSLALPSANTALSWIDRIAVLAHEANRIWCLLHGDTSQPNYVNAPDWQRESAHVGVSKIASGEITTPEQSHESWSQQKLADGWTFGPVKNPDVKQHPCLVPYDQLPPEQRAKDAIFFGIVKGLVDQYRASGQLGAGVEPR
jgi:hypothetical protein